MSRHMTNQQNDCVPSEDLGQPGLRPVWSESSLSLCTQWVAKDPSFLHVDGEDSDQTGWKFEQRVVFNS